jgi:hypothetical protein
MSGAPTTIGILGGGQLARMLALAGAPLGLRFLVLDVAADACAAQCAPLIVADYHDAAALDRYADAVDVATFDFENVPAEAAKWLVDRLPVYPNPDALAVAQDRLAEKQLFLELGMGTPAFRAVESTRSPAQRRLPRDRSARRVRPGRGAPRAHLAAEPAVHSARARGDRRHVCGFSQRRQHVPQRVLALEGERIQPRTLCRRAIESGALRAPRDRARVLRDPFAHVGLNSRVCAPLLRGDR